MSRLEKWGLIDIENIPDTDAGNLALYHELARIERDPELLEKQASLRTKILLELSRRGLIVEPIPDAVAKPIPTPRSGESQRDFISRCMSEFPDEDMPQKQRLAICYSKWRASRKDGEE